jgi:hypothetical protein
MGSSTSKPAAAASLPAVPATSAEKTPMLPAAATAPLEVGKTLRDTTLRSAVFGMKDVKMTAYKNSQVTLASPVDKAKFDEYMWVLHTMAQLARLIYSDAGIVREVLLSPQFGADNNTAVNDLITSLDKKYAVEKKTKSALPGSIEGRPPQSYVLQEGKGTEFARYISSPSDVTFMFLDKSKLKAPFFQAGDVVLVFKGSSTAKNFKHDLYSQVKIPKDISDVFTNIPKTGDRKNLVPPGFIDPLLKNWSLILQGIKDFKAQRLFITGQSLGGAYATLTSFVLGLTKPAGVQQIHLVTFGSPTIAGDGARNTFNEILDSGYMTLDRVVSYGNKSQMADIIPSVPIGFSHPGFQPLRTELYPELKTGRAYNLDTIRKVFTGGAFGIGKEKTAYEGMTITHMPNRMVIPAKDMRTQAFAHGEYFDMTYLGVLRLPGLKNPGFKDATGGKHTFVAGFNDAGIDFKYVDSQDTTVSEDPSVGDGDFTSLAKEAPAKGGRGTRRKRKLVRRRRTLRKM